MMLTKLSVAILITALTTAIASEIFVIAPNGGAVVGVHASNFLRAKSSSSKSRSTSPRRGPSLREKQNVDGFTDGMPNSARYYENAPTYRFLLPQNANVPNIQTRKLSEKFSNKQVINSFPQHHGVLSGMTLKFVDTEGAHFMGEDMTLEEFNPMGLPMSFASEPQ